MIKWLKLFMFLLIGGLILLPSISSAGDFYLNIPATISDSINENILTFIPSNNFIVNSQYQVFQVKGSGSYPRLQTVFWSNTGLYIISSCAGGYGCQNIHTSIQKQGYITKYCKTTYGNTCTDKNLNASDFYSLDSYKTADYLYIQTNGDLQYFNFCFNYESLNEAICFSVNEATNIYSNSKGFTYNPYISELGTSVDQISSYFTQSPFTPLNPVIPDYSIGTGGKIRNYEALMGFEYMGLSQQLCYGGFELDNLYLESEKFSEWTGYNFGGGASIFQLHNTYSGGSTLKPFLSSYYQSYLNGQVSNFYNKSKGLFMFYQQYYSSSNLDSHSFNLGDLRDYCDLLFYLIDNNWENDGDEYTGNNQHAIDSYNQNKKTNDGGFTNTGVLGTGNFTGFESADAFFGRLTNLFQSNVNGVNGDFSPMIPSYIVVFMLAFILIRIISH